MGLGCCVSKGKENEVGISTALAKEGKAGLMICKTALPSCKSSRIYTLLWSADNASHIAQ
jgi:hypothetical protein